MIRVVKMVTVIRLVKMIRVVRMVTMIRLDSVFSKNEQGGQDDQDGLGGE